MASSLLVMADRALDGNLETLLNEWRTEGISYAEMSGRLRDRAVTVSYETVRAWCIKYGIGCEA